MADDTTGTVLGFPGLTLPGVVGEDGPGDGLPTLAPLTTEFAPPASLSVPEGPELGGNSETAAHGMEAAPAAGSGSLAGVASMSTVMMAGITVAALRGAYHAVGYLKARAEHFKAVRDQQNAVTGKANTELEKARAAALAAQQRGRVQSGPEFGRNSRGSGPNSSPNSGRANSQVPSTFRSTGQTGPGGPQPKKPETGRGGGQDGRSGAPGSTGPGRVQEARRKALEDSGRKGRQDGNSGAQNGSRNGSLNTGQQRPQRQPAGPDTIRGAARQRAADRILNGPKDKQPGADRKGPGERPGKPERTPAGPDTIRGAARRRVADRITTGNWKPTGAHTGGGATPTTIRGAVRKRAVDRILNGKKPKDTAKDGTADTTKPASPSTELAVRPGSTGTGTGTGTAGTGSTAGTRSGRRTRRTFTPGGESGSRPWRLRRPGTTAPGSPEDIRARKRREQQERKTRQRQERQERKTRQARERAQRANARRSQQASSTGTGPTGQAAGAGTDGFGPPPGWMHSTEHKVRRYDRPDPDKAAPAIGRGQASLPRAPYNGPHARPGTTRPTPMPPASPVGGRHVTIPVPRTGSGTQYAGDSDLTIHDVIEADADMAEEILQGADDARLAAEGCEKLLGRLEALHAKVVDLKVPGVLESMVASLIDKTEEVKAKADAVAEAIPAAAEAIAAAGTNAARRDKPVADITRDMGHAAPAERDYHEK
ncbi:hypothetical protein PUR71_09000 [Streptomyces sp. SP17BM10]|uniref:hypothetical protein n=1 Tax=Streptomyces sp. SP17BM10 TaxID=3002530 RepID=UPI002E7A203A|nr:hypothetical protein [Streptomyces sp. SP17BM10]MEE1783052.1 hypothetical protein [Streptomyces sp. SP17BM10]